MASARPVFRAVVAATVLLVLGEARASDSQDFHRIEQGRYLATVGDCEACHDDPVSGRAYGGGRAIETPFGTVLAPNITADRETGIGAWTDDEFVNALRRGTGRFGQHLYPAMPFPSYTKMTRDDALAIRAYIESLPAEHHAVIANQLPFPFSVRAGMAAWNALFFKEGVFAPVSGKSAQWNRGAFLVEGPGHCAACHTPKNWLGGDETAKAFQGSSQQGWWSPPLTGSVQGGLGDWTKDDIAAYLKSGHNRFAAASGPMAEEVSLSSSRMTAEDLQAIAVYIKDLPGGPTNRTDEASPRPGDGVMTAGAALYRDACAACHKPDGSGVPMLFPDLRHLGAVDSADPSSLLRVVIRGARSVATGAEPTSPAMPSFGWLLSDDQIASLATYVRNSFGNAAPAVTAASVTKARDELAKRPD